MESLLNSAAMPKTAYFICRQSLASIIKSSNILTKWLPVSTASPSQRRPLFGQWCIVIYLRIIDPGQSNRTTFLGSASMVTTGSQQFPTGVLTFNSTEKALRFTIYRYILRLPKKCAIFDEIEPLDCEINLTQSGECAR